MAAHAFHHVDTWIFDLDNTLYRADSNLFDQIDVRITQYLERFLGTDPVSARAAQKRYYLDHGTTLNGLMLEHNADPKPYLDFVHDIDLSPISASADLRAAVDALPGRRLIFTNGSHRHAERVVDRLGLNDLFHDFFDIEDTGYVPKPDQAAFDSLVARHRFDPNAAAMFEDLARNLVPAHGMGMKTVLVTSDKDWAHEPDGAKPANHADDLPDHVHFSTPDLAGFLRSLRLEQHST
jgi:putative hydrolase of the HAD superfamily